MKRSLPNCKLYLLLIVLTINSWSALAQVPVNPNATQRARDVLRYIYNAKDQGFITGQHTYAQTWISDSDLGIKAHNFIYEKTGEWPGLWGSDFSFTDPNYTIEQLQASRQKMINRAVEMDAANALITLTYHMVNPKYEENAGWDKVKEDMTEAEYLEVVTPGTTLYNNWKRNIDRIVPFLKELETQDIAVVWRPYHEMNGIFWWGRGTGSQKYFKQLWINTYNYMVVTHGVNNLIWFWSPNHFTSANYQNPTDRFPGLDYVDMLGVDDYYWEQSGFLSQGDYDLLVNLAQGKPLAIGEGYNPNMVMPDATWIKQNRPEYRWFMLWDDEWVYTRDDTPEKLANLLQVYQHENAINRDNIFIPTGEEDTELPSLPTDLAVTGKESKTVSLSWTASTDNIAVAGYEVFVDDVFNKYTSLTSTTVSGLSPSTMYNIKVRARDTYGNKSDFSTPVTVTTEDPETIPPTVPGNVRSNGKTSTTLSLLWDASTDNIGVTGYNVFLNGVLDTTVLIPAVTIINLTEATEYNITVSAKDDAGNTSNLSSSVAVSTYAPEPGTVIINDSNLTYSGTWGSSTGSKKYLNDDHYSNSTGAYYTYAFTGTRVNIFAAKASHHGIAAVSIDNGPETEVDFYAPYRIDLTLVWQSPELTYGNHTLKVLVKGTKNDAGSGYVIPADRLDVVKGIGLDTEAPSAPTGLSVTAKTYNSVSLTWTTSTDNIGVTGYDVYVNGTLKTSTATNSVTISGLSQQTAYTFTIKAKDGGDNVSDFSQALEVTTEADTDVNLVLNPGFENDLTSWRITGGTVVIDTENSFEGTKSAKVGPTNWSWLDQTFTGWTAGKTYKFSAWGKVAASGNSVRVALKGSTGDLKYLDFSSTTYTQQSASVVIPATTTWLQIYVSNRTSGTGYVDYIKVVEEAPVDTEAPTTPTELNSPSKTSNSVSLAWTASTDNTGVTSYDVYVDNIFNKSVTTNTATISGLASGTKYVFTVKAKDAAGNTSSVSNPLEVKTAAAIINLLTNPGFENDLTGWTKVSGDGVIDTEFVSEGVKSLKVGPTNWGWVEQVISTGFTPGETYVFAASARTASGVGPFKVAIQINNTGSDLVKHDFSTTSFVEKSLEFTLPANTTSIKVYITNRDKGTGYFDDIKLSKKIFPDTEAPTAPTQVVVTAKSTNTISVSWTASTDNIGVTEYDVYVNDVFSKTTATTSVEITGLTPNTLYSITVKAKDDEGNISAASTAIEETTNAETPVSGFINLGFENDMTGWTKVSGDGSVQTIEVSEGTKALKVGPTNWSWVEQAVTSGFIPGKTYIFTGSARTESGAGPIKLAIQINNSGSDLVKMDFTTTTYTQKSVEFILPANTTSMKIYMTNRDKGTGFFDGINLIEKVVADTEAPTTPTQVVVTAKTSNAISISWAASTDNIGVTGYDVYVNNAFSKSTATTTAEITGLTANTLYSISIKAKDNAGNVSAASTAIEETTDADTPVSGFVNLGFENDMTGWTKVSGDGSVQALEVAEGSKALKVGPTNWSWVEQVVTTGFTPGKVYVFSGSARTETGAGPIKLAIQVNNSGSDLVKMDFTTTAYVEKSVEFTMPANATSVKIYMTNRDKGTGFFDNISLAEKVIPDTEAPTAPTQLLSTGKTTSAISLSWTASTDNIGVAEYDVYVDGVFSQTTNTTSAEITGLTPNTTYSITIKAKDDAGNVSAASSALEETTDADTEAPTAPTQVVVTAKSLNSITLSWTESTDNIGVTGYDVFVNDVFSKTTATTSVQITGLNANTTYSITIKAKDDAGNVSSASMAIEETTDADTEAPTGPTQVEVISKTSTTISLSWIASNDNIGVIGYDVFVNGVFSKTVESNSVELAGLTANTLYSITVKAKDDAGNVSTPSAAIQETTNPDTAAPTTPTQVVANAKTSTTITLSWAASTDNIGVTEYEVYVNESLSMTTESNSVVITGLTPGTLYSITIKAKDDAGNISSASTAIEETTSPDTEAPTTPTQVVVTAKTLNSISLSWTASTDNVAVKAYDVYVDGAFVLSTETTSAEITGLSPNTLYSFTIKAKDAEGNTSSSSAAVNETTDPDEEAPTAPGNIQGASTMYSVTLNWDAATDNIGVTNYNVYLDETMVGSTVDLSSVISDLQPSTEYQFTVIALDAAGNESQASVLNISTLADTEAPSAPLNLEAIAEETLVSLSWDMPSDNVGVVGYKIYQDNVMLQTIEQTTVDVNDLNVGTTYVFAVSAIDAAGNESEKATVEITTNQPVGTEDPLPGGGTLKVFPNPFDEYVMISIHGINVNGNVKYQIQSFDGKSVLQGQLRKQDNYEVRLDTSELDPGAYILILRETKTYTKTLIKK